MNSIVFSPDEERDLRSRALPKPTARNLCVEDLEGAVLFGAGVFASMLMPHLKQAGVTAGWFVDSNPALWGSIKDGLPILPPDSLDSIGQRLVVIMTHHFRDMLDVCQGHQVQRWAWFTELKEVFGNYTMVADAQEILTEPCLNEVMGILRDEASRDVLKHAVAARITGDSQDYPRCTPGQYFNLPELPDEAYTSFVDVGAYDGDTLRDWLNSKEPHLDSGKVAYHAFEPDPGSFLRLQGMIGTLDSKLVSQIHAYPLALGSSACRIRIISGGLTSNIHEGSEDELELHQARLDDLLLDQPLTLIKIDVEGQELGVLEGARDCIKRWNPALLVAIYHCTEHLWEIPLWIHSLGQGYRLYLRHHDHTVCETICYAIPDGRWSADPVHSKKEE